MNKLQAALEWARRGFAVFPLQPNAKVPLPGSRGHLDATTDPARIREWWIDPATGQPRDFNIGASPRDGRHIILDLDVKDGRQGIADYLALGGEISGLVVRTATGGLHVYCVGEDLRTGAGRLAPGIDTRGPDGYVVAPGSTIDGQTYEVVEDGGPHTVPTFVAEKIGTRTERKTRVIYQSVESDQPQNVQRAVQVARSAEPAVTGCWHDMGYKLGCEMARIGLSPEKAIEVLAEHWVPRGSGFKSEAQFRRDVLGGYHDAVGDGEHGTASLPPAESVFGGVRLPALYESLPDIFPSRTWSEGHALRDLPVPYVVKHLFGPGDLAAVLGGPGSGKSVVLPYLAFCVALGQPFLGRRVAPGRVLYFATENGLGLERRIQVLGDKLGDPGDMLRVFPSSVNLSAGAAGDHAEDLARLVNTIRFYEPVLVIIDTLFAAFPATDLTDRGAEGINYVMQIAKGIAALPCRPAQVWGHHTPKSGETAYGGQQLQAAFDTTLFVHGDLKADREIVIRKNRMGPDGDKYKFRIQSAVICVDSEGEEITAPIIEMLTDARLRIETTAQQDAWLAQTTTGARVVRDTLERLTENAEAAGQGTSAGERLAGGPIARVRRSDLVEALVVYGLIEERCTPAERGKLADSWLKELRLREFVDYDVSTVWLLPRPTPDSP
jgi:hypothetical protein